MHRVEAALHWQLEENIINCTCFFFSWIFLLHHIARHSWYFVHPLYIPICCYTFRHYKNNRSIYAVSQNTVADLLCTQQKSRKAWQYSALCDNKKTTSPVSLKPGFIVRMDGNFWHSGRPLPLGTRVSHTDVWNHLNHQTAWLQFADFLLWLAPLWGL